jgi:hypothetical protein
LKSNSISNHDNESQEQSNAPIIIALDNLTKNIHMCECLADMIINKLNRSSQANDVDFESVLAEELKKLSEADLDLGIIFS